MKRALILLTHRRQLAAAIKSLESQKNAMDQISVAALTPESRLLENEVALLNASGAHCINFHETKMELDHDELSQITAPLIRSAMEQLLGDAELSDRSTYWGISLMTSQENSIYTYGYRHLISAIEHIRVLVNRVRPDVIVTFGPSRRAFRYMERPDIERLYDNELIYAYLIEATAKALGIGFELKRNISFGLAVLKLRLRGLLMRAYKFYVLARRVLRDQRGRSRALTPTSTTKPRICFLIRGESEYWTFKPALQRLRESGAFEVVILQDDIIKDPSAKSVLERSGEKFIPVHAFVSPIEFVRRFMQGIVLSRRFDRRLRHIHILSNSRERDRSLHAQILGGESVYARELAGSMSKRFSEKVVFVSELARFIELYQPQLFVTMSMVDNWGALLSDTGERFGVKTLSIQNAALAFLCMPTMIFAHKFAVASQRQRDGLIEAGADSEKIVVTGIPRYDPYFSETHVPESARMSLKIPADMKLILMATQPTDHYENVEYIKETLRSVAGFSDAVTLIKLHPRERMSDYREIEQFIESGGYDARLIQQYDVLELINAADLMLSRVSTTIQSALMIGTPVIAYISRSNQHAQRDYLETSAVVRISELNELPGLLTEWMTNYTDKFNEFSVNRSGYLAQTVGVADGKASERIVDLITEMTESDAMAIKSNESS